MELRPYQNEAIRSVYKAWEKHDRVLLVMATGTGKTIVFSSITSEETKRGRVLILAHRKELIEQAQEKLYKNFGILADIEQGPRTALSNPENVATCAMVQTLASQRDGVRRRLESFPKDYYSTIIIDEAHHSKASQYEAILNHFDGAKVLGVTATPDRGDGKLLADIYDDVAFEYSIEQGIRDEYLTKIMVQTCPLKIDLSDINVAAGDYQSDALGDAIEPEFGKVSGMMMEYAADRKTVVFLPLVRSARTFAEVLNRRGFRAAAVWGDMKKTDREQVLKDFEDSKYNVICNAMLLTEGWDCPSVDCVVVLRPTRVRSLYVQMVGRGTRLYPGKEDVLLLDFLWMDRRKAAQKRLKTPVDIIESFRSPAVKRMLSKQAKSGEPLNLVAEKDAVERTSDADQSMKQKLMANITDVSEFYEIFADGDFFELPDCPPEKLVFFKRSGWHGLTPFAKKWVKDHEYPDESYRGKIAKLATGEWAINNVDSRQPSRALYELYAEIDERLKANDRPSLKAVSQLTRDGFHDVASWNRFDANKILKLKANNGWKVPS